MTDLEFDQPVNRNEFIVEFEDYAYGGEGFGRLPDGRAVFVPLVGDGEVARIRLVESKKNYARGELIELIEVAKERIEPRCIHFGVCGGCHYQHLPYEKQLAVKENILKDQLRRIGRIEDPPIKPIVPSPNPYHYRNHVQFHLDETGRLGYMQLLSNEIFPIEECHLPEDPINDLWPRLSFDALPGFNRIALRTGVGEDLMMIIGSEDPSPIEFDTDLPISVVYAGPGGEMVLAGEDYIILNVLGQDFKVSVDSFFQVNTGVAEKMVEHVLKFIPQNTESIVLDAFCGVGLFSAFIAPRVGQVIGIESNPLVCEDFVVNLDKFDNVVLYEAEVKTVLPVLETRPDVMLVDPPRAGLRGEVIDGINHLGPETLIYTSCDPATLARDAKRLTKIAYSLESITPFDMFPQTSHIESISIWRRSQEPYRS
ncbi:MAG: TRAM domain-containing protein [Gammaproteobacteria bacterium]|nr:TRAM domain-containing protein [Gammaproteobacteria bacterium]